MIRIVVASCASYSDAWKPFHHFFKKHWMNCPYPMTLITDFNPPNESWPGHHAVVLGSDYGWTKNLVVGLSKIAEEFVLFMQEDFFMTGMPDPTFVTAALDEFRIHPEVQCVRLMPCPGPDVDHSEKFGRIADDASYRVSCQVAIWRKDHLSSILDKVNSPAEFEIMGSKLPPTGVYLSVYRKTPFPFPYLVSAIGRGKWSQDAVRMCAADGIKLDLKRRRVEDSPNA